MIDVDSMTPCRIGLRNAKFYMVECSLHSCKNTFEQPRHKVIAYNRAFCSQKCYRAKKGIRKTRLAFDCLDCSARVSEQEVYTHDFRTMKVCNKCYAKRKLDRIVAQKIKQRCFVKKFNKEFGYE